MIPVLMPIFKRADLAFDYGEGSNLYASDGRRFLDFGAGIAVSALGHNHPSLVKAIAEQAQRVLHVSNLYRIPQAEQLAASLVERSFADSVFFCNSGAEANEGMIKMIRRVQAHRGASERTEIICFTNAFHGRTLAALAATGNPKYLEDFGPVSPGFRHVPFNDSEALRAAITPQTAGIMVELIQGESGVTPAQADFITTMAQLCSQHRLILAIDEVQTGIGRSGKLFAYEWYGIRPDILTLAKGLAGGVPIGAVLASKEIASSMMPGSHGSTFGGNPLACAAGNVVLETVAQPAFLEHITSVGARLEAGLRHLVDDYPSVFSLYRGRGLMWGLKCEVAASDIFDSALQNQLLCTVAGNNVLRLLPPLIVSDEECDLAVEILRKVAKVHANKVMETV